jgi:hypothetical protein
MMVGDTSDYVKLVSLVKKKVNFAKMFFSGNYADAKR